MKLTNEQLKFLQDNEVVFFATASDAGVPRVIPIVPSIIEADKIIISNMQMEISSRNVCKNSNVFLYAIDKNMDRNLKISGMAKYIYGGELFESVLRLESKRCEFIPRGIIEISVESIVENYENE